MRFAPFVLVLILAATPAATAITGGGIWTDRKPQKRGNGLMKAMMLSTHNDARAALGQPPLVWDKALAEEARRYAVKLARERRFEHSDPKTRARREGENLWKGTRTAYRYDQMAGHWIEERKDIKSGRFPDVSRTGNWHHVAHYTQIVWRDTTAFGCGFASNKADDYLVCRYTPPGNVVGQDGLAIRSVARPK